MRRRFHPFLPVLSGLLLFLSAGLLLGCDEEVPPIERDLGAIQARDTLVMLTTFNSTSYFLYRGEPLGYEYELLRAFAEAHDLALKTVLVRDRDSLYTLLNQGVGDILAARLIPGEQDSSRAVFTRDLYRTPPALVQRTAPPRAFDLPGQIDTLIDVNRRPAEVPDSLSIQARLITRPAELADEEVFMSGNSGYYDQLVELSETISGDIEIVQLGGEVSAESLIRSVATGDIELTVTQANVARLHETYYTNITVRPRVGAPEGVAWAVRRNAPQLLAALNAWIEEEREELFPELYDRYFVDRNAYRNRVQSAYLTSETGRLSPYDELLRRYAAELRWDWRLLASQAFQESRFQPEARSWAGATGLLQLMPATAREFGVNNALDPEQNVQGAVRFLAWLTDYWEDELPDESERLKFILASYNTGHGHVEDARRLAVKHGDNPDEWTDVAYWLLRKSKRTYYTDPVVKYGFCRGLEPVTYVSLILDRYEHYKQFVEADAAANTAAGAAAVTDA